MTAETPRTEQQHWAEAVAECITDEQEALRIVGFYEDGEWQPAMLAIGRENLALKRDLTAARGRVAELEKALKPFANFACDAPCQCNNCVARALLSPSPEPTK